MEKMVGNVINRIAVFILLVSNYIIASDSAIILSMQDMNHKPISQAMCQSPFMLQVELKNIDGYTDVHLMQYITGIENFKSSRSMTSHNVSIDNGKKTVKTFYNFVLRADKKGKFTLGPLSLKNTTGNSVRSNRLIISVGDEQILSEKDSKEKYFMTMAVNKKQVYVGEKITLSVKFYDRLFVDDLHLQFPEFENLYIVKNKNKISKNMVVLDDEEYSVTEWLFDMYATHPGALIIQDIHAAFFAPELESKFKFGGSFDFFRSLHKSQQHVTSQPIKIDVVPLPAHKDFHNVQAVGQFSKFNVVMKQNSVQAGQGIVAAVELFGNANFETMEPITLSLPEHFNYYDSNTVTIDEKRTCKHCEFIVQASTAGRYQIEKQSLVYFDPIDAQYKTIYSNSIGDVTITPAVQLPQSSRLSENDIDAIEKTESTPKELQDFYIIEKGSVHERMNFAIPLGLFQNLLLLLLWMWLLLAVYQSWLKQYFLNNKFLNNYIIFSRAKKSCNLAFQRRETYKLYPIFMQLFTKLTGVHVGQLHHAVILQYLIDKNFSREHIASWEKFYEQILQASFASQDMMQQQVLFQQTLFKQAEQWIKILKEKA